jgi:hypothetical protein
MRSGSADPDSSANGGRKAQKSLKACTAPQFKILTPEQAAAELRAKALPISFSFPRNKACYQQNSHVAGKTRSRRAHRSSPTLETLCRRP